MRKTKMAALFLALMLAMGVSGFAYAWWTDTLTIHGVVDTATFGWELTLDEYWVWHDGKDIVYLDAYLCDFIYPEWGPVEGYAKRLEIDIDDLYPGALCEVWWDIHFYGSVPGHITSIDIALTLNGVPLMEIPPWLVFMVRPGDNNLGLPYEWMTISRLAELFGVHQWHMSDWCVVHTLIRLVETDMVFNDGSVVPAGVEPPQGATIELTISINGEQYNVGTPPTQGPPPP